MPKNKKIVFDKVCKNGFEFFIRPAENVVLDENGKKVGRYSFMKDMKFMDIIL